MRVIESKKNPKSGERYHHCPSTQAVESIQTCRGCSALEEIESLPASYRVHCTHGTVVKALIPSHAEDGIPQNWGTDKFLLSQYSIIEPKLDGARCVIVVDDEGRFHAFTRRTNRFGDQTEITDNLPHLKDWKIPELAGTIQLRFDY